MSDAANHWDSVYQRKRPEEVSWFQPHLDRSFELMARCGVTPGSAIIDVGAGASTFVDDLLARGHRDVTVLDVSAAAIDEAKQRLGARASEVRWLVGDITQLELPVAAFDFWHDRAVFHFLRSADERRRYVAAISRALRPGGHAVVATFGPHGPERCSGLEVTRYSPDELHAQFGATFERLDSVTETHQTPWGTLQEFVYCRCRFNAAPRP